MNNSYAAENFPHGKDDTLQPDSMPTVVVWFKVYAVILAVTYLCCTALGGLMMFVTIEDPETPPWVFHLMGCFLFGLGLLLLVACIVPLVMKPRPWLWVYDLVLICLGMTSACFMLFSIPLLIFWMKPATKRYFGKPE